MLRVIALVALLFGTVAIAAEAVDSSKLHGDAISRKAAIVVHAFDTSGAKLGKAKHQDTAKRAAEIAPHLLAVDIVATLRDHDFTAVELSDSSTTDTGDAMQLVGEFTEINPGSQATRAWIGFGAGASRICVSGKLLDATGKTVGEFKDCEKGLGWGNSITQTSGEEAQIGANIAELLNSWAE